MDAFNLKRRSMRLPDYDYSSPGFYFVTLCVQNKELKMGTLNQHDINLNRIGYIVKECWEWLEEQYSYVRLDEYIIMPDHLHGIINILDTNCWGGSGAALYNEIKPLGSLIGAFKTVSTKRINQFILTPGKRFWQRNYYDRVIRDDKDLDEIRYYVRFNADK